jgi:Na+/proline symporter
MTQPTRPQRPVSPRHNRLSPEELEARTRAIVIICLVSVLLGSVGALLYSLIFVYQPAEQSPNDAAFLKILEPLMFSIGGALTGLAAGRAMSSSKKEGEE